MLNLILVSIINLQFTLLSVCQLKMKAARLIKKKDFMMNCCSKFSCTSAKGKNVLLFGMFSNFFLVILIVFKINYGPNCFSYSKQSHPWEEDNLIKFNIYLYNFFILQDQCKVMTILILLYIIYSITKIKYANISFTFICSFQPN